MGEIISRFERRGLDLLALKSLRIDEGLAGEHYGVHAEKPFYDSLIEYITSGPVVAMVWEGENAIVACRSTMGATDPAEATPGTIRGDFGLDVSKNLVHGSDSEKTAQKEISLFFDEDDLLA